MGCESTTRVLVGLHEVGLVGLHAAFREIEGSPAGPEEQMDRLLELLGRDNYIPPARAALYRRAVWREYLRHRGEDYRDFLSEIPVLVQGEPGDELTAFVDLVTKVFATHELKPLVTFDAPQAGRPTPRLLIEDDVVAEGPQSFERLRQAVRKRITGW